MKRYIALEINGKPYVFFVDQIRAVYEYGLHSYILLGDDYENAFRINGYTVVQIMSLIREASAI